MSTSLRSPASSTLGPVTHAALRIGAGLLFMQHGVQKLFGFFGGVGPHGETVQLMSQLGLAGVLETFGGLLIVLGLLTRPVAMLLAIEMLVAYFQVHAPQGACRSRIGASCPCSSCSSGSSSPATAPDPPAWTRDARRGLDSSGVIEHWRATFRDLRLEVNGGPAPDVRAIPDLGAEQQPDPVAVVAPA